MEDSETILGWMKSNERRFLMVDNKNLESNSSTVLADLNETNESPLKSASNLDLCNELQELQENPQISLDQFFNSTRKQTNYPSNEQSLNSHLFDEHFSLADFRNLTQQWKKEHKIAS
ncbi:MAG: hypothetical protein ACTSWC_00015 [Promethearchaeota archaeon]